MRDVSAAVGAVLVLVAALGAGVPAVAGADAGAGASAAVAQEQCSYPVSVNDATDVKVTVEEEPERIVTLAPSAAQTLWELNASGKVVGVSSNAAYLDGAGEKEVVVDGLTVQNEKVIGLEPDLVLAPDVIKNDTVRSLRDSGLTVYRFDQAESFADVYNKTELIGRLSGECAAASATVADMRERVTAIREAVSDEEKPGALYSFFGYTAGNRTFIDSIITSAGLTNVAATEFGITGYPNAPLSNEVIANSSDDIEWLIFNDTPGSKPTAAVYNATTAMQQNQTVVLNANYINQPAPRTVWALKNLTKAVHPEAYREAQAALQATPSPTATASPTATPTATETPTATDTTGDDAATATTADSPTATDEPAAATTTTGSGPGFTAVPGLLAVVVVALLFRRR